MPAYLNLTEYPRDVKARPSSLIDGWVTSRRIPVQVVDTTGCSEFRYRAMFLRRVDGHIHFGNEKFDLFHPPISFFREQYDQPVMRLESTDGRHFSHAYVDIRLIEKLYLPYFDFVPGLYHFLRDGLDCQLGNKTAVFESEISALAFKRVYPDWKVQYRDLAHVKRMGWIACDMDRQTAVFRLGASHAR